MELFIQQIASGLTSGAIYACVALGLVMIYVSTDHINFAQGEMAMFSTYIAWALVQAGLSYWVAFAATVLISFASGLFIQRVILKRCCRSSTRSPASSGAMWSSSSRRPSRRRRCWAAG